MAPPLEMPKVAIFEVAMIGHVNPTFALVQELVSRGCKVHYFVPMVEQIRKAVKDSGAIVETYHPDFPELVLEQCGIEERPEEVLLEEQRMWERAVWPLASSLLCCEYLYERCKALDISLVLYDPIAPHGLIVAELLEVPKASLVTYPGMGSLSDLMSSEEVLRRAASFRKPYGQLILKQFGVDLEVELLTRRQYYAELNFVTTCEDLVAPLPDLPWARELKSRFDFVPVGCLVSPSAPHVAEARANKLLQRHKSFGHALPVAELEEQMALGRKVVFAALGTMATSDRWDIDLGRSSAGNLPMGTTGKQYCQHVWKALLEAMEILGEDYYCVLCAGKQPDALDFLEDLPSNVIVRTFVPQVEMLNNYTSVFVSHVGFNSLQESLMAGVPLVAIPQAVDQPANAMKVQSCAWGVSFLDPMATVTAPALAEALRRAPSCAKAVAVAKRDLAGGALRLAEQLLRMSQRQE